MSTEPDVFGDSEETINGFEPVHNMDIADLRDMAKKYVAQASRDALMDFVGTCRARLFGSELY